MYWWHNINEPKCTLTCRLYVNAFVIDLSSNEISKHFINKWSENMHAFIIDFIISVSVSRCAYVFVYTHQRERPVCLLYLYTSYISVSILLIHLIYQFARLTNKHKCINHINPYRNIPRKNETKKKHLHQLSHSSSKENKYIQTFRTARTWITWAQGQSGYIDS